MEYFEQLVRDYGYWALVIGTFLEGETIVIIAGILAASTVPANQIIDVRWTILAAFLGSVSGDQFYFYVGRLKGQWLLAKMPTRRARIENVLAMLERNSTWLLLTFRFFYGLRNVTSFGVGMSRIGVARFTVLNAIGALVWACSFALGGYLFGHAMVRIVEGAKHYQLIVIGGVCAVAMAIWLFRMWRRHRARLRAAATAESALASPDKCPTCGQPFRAEGELCPQCGAGR